MARCESPVSLFGFASSLCIPWNFVGILLLADLDAVARNAALKGGVSLTDAGILCPGFHKQQDAPSLSKGEYPACAAMTTGYVFRVENEATVYFLQRVSTTGHLTTINVDAVESNSTGLFGGGASGTFGVAARVLVGTALFDSARDGDTTGVVALGILVLVRALNIYILQRRASTKWHGQEEPGVLGDLLVLLSQDRWVRIRGLVDSLKAVTSGQWLRDYTPIERVLTSIGTMLVYAAAMLMAAAGQKAQLYLMFVVLLSFVALILDNELAGDFSINGKLLKAGKPKPYKRRLDLAEDLIKESGRRDWAVQMGMVHGESEGPVTM